MRQGKARIVVDRCNLTRRERAEWLDVVGKPPASEVVCVFFDADVEECKQRAAARLGHPTIRAGGGARIIAEQAINGGKSAITQTSLFRFTKMNRSGSHNPDFLVLFSFLKSHATIPLL